MCDAPRDWVRIGVAANEEAFYPPSPCVKHCSSFYQGFCIERRQLGGQRGADFGDLLVSAEYMPRMYGACPNGSFYDLLSRGCCPPACS